MPTCAFTWRAPLALLAATTIAATTLLPTEAHAQQAAPRTAQQEPRRPARTILFVGNSFTFGDGAGGPELVRPFGAHTVTDLNGTGIGGVPALFRHFAHEAGLHWAVSLETSPGKGLDWHATERMAVVARHWDAVVLQSYSTLDAQNPGNPTRLIAATTRLADTLHARNPKVAIHLVATWTRADQTYLPGGRWYGQSVEAMARDVEAGYDSARVRARWVRGVVPVGAAWSRAIRTGVADANPFDGMDGGKLDLWAPDGYHASVYGYYLEALVIFGAVTGTDPRTLGADETAARSLGIPPARAAALQSIAWEELASRSSH